MSLPRQAATKPATAAGHNPEALAQKEIDPADVIPWLPCTVSLEIPLHRFTICDLTRLAKGSVVTTSCPRNSDVPLYVNGQLIGWTELEVIDDRLAVRITEVA